MPHIIIDEYHSQKNIRHIYLHADVEFSSDYFHTPKANERLRELNEKLEAVVSEYFDNVCGDIYSNHEWNSKQ